MPDVSSEALVVTLHEFFGGLFDRTTVLKELVSRAYDHSPPKSHEAKEQIIVKALAELQEGKCPEWLAHSVTHIRRDMLHG